MTNRTYTDDDGNTFTADEMVQNFCDAFSLFNDDEILGGVTQEICGIKVSTDKFAENMSENGTDIDAELLTTLRARFA
jgi:hypothetical protein